MTKTIAIIACSMRQTMCESYVYGIQRAANRMGYSTVSFSMLQISDLFTNNEEAVYQLIDPEAYDGIILVASNFTHKDLLKNLEEMLAANYSGPIISIGASSRFPSVAISKSAAAAEMLTDHLIDIHGCESIYFLGGDRNSIGNYQRGIQASYEKHKLPFSDSQILMGGFWVDCAEKCAKNIASGRLEKPDAIFCVSDIVANALVEALFMYNIRVPEDVIVIGNGAYLSSTNDLFPLTTIDTSRDNDGEHTFMVLHKLMTGIASPPIPLKSPFIVHGMSCGCGPHKAPDVRFRLETRKELNTKDMEYRNSRLEERLYQIKNHKDLVYQIRNLVYLIPGKDVVSVSLWNPSQDNAECIFQSNFLETEKSMTFPAKDIVPNGSIPEEIHNIQVLPLIFDSRVHGFLSLINHDVHVLDNQAKRFVHTLSIAIDLLKSRQAAGATAPADEPSAEELYTEPAPVAVPPIEASLVSPSGLVEPMDYRVDTPTTGRVDYIFANKNGILCKVDLANIYYFETEGNRVMAALKSGKYPVKKHLFELENQLMSMGFLRISKSTIVNMSKVASFYSNEDRSITATLTNKEELRVSRKYVSEFKKHLML